MSQDNLNGNFDVSVNGTLIAYGNMKGDNWNIYLGTLSLFSLFLTKKLTSSQPLLHFFFSFHFLFLQVTSQTKALRTHRLPFRLLIVTRTSLSLLTALYLFSRQINMASQITMIQMFVTSFCWNSPRQRYFKKQYFCNFFLSLIMFWIFR